MVASCTGQGKHINRSTRRGGSDSGSDFFTTKFSPSPQQPFSTDVHNGARSRCISSSGNASNGLQGSQPLMFVRIIVPMLARVMNTNNSRCYPWEDRKQ